MMWFPEDSDVVARVNVAVPLESMTGPPETTLSTRNCTVPVGVAPAAVPPFATVAVNVTAVPLVTEVALAVRVVVEITVPVVPAPAGVTSVHEFARTNASTDPHPVARS
jgi:hypothetical protein